MELLDLLTPDGLPTGRTKPKPEVHRDGDWHRAAHLWLITTDRRVLLQRRSARKENWPNLWDVSVAGHISAGESAIDAAIRETQEEIGLALTPSDLKHLGTLRWHAVLNDGAYIENEFHEVFVATVDIDIEVLVLDPEEVAEIALVHRKRSSDTTLCRTMRSMRYCANTVFFKKRAFAFASARQ